MVLVLSLMNYNNLFNPILECFMFFNPFIILNVMRSSDNIQIGWHSDENDKCCFISNK